MSLFENNLGCRREPLTAQSREPVSPTPSRFRRLMPITRPDAGEQISVQVARRRRRSSPLRRRTASHIPSDLCGSARSNWREPDQYSRTGSSYDPRADRGGVIKLTHNHHRPQPPRSTGRGCLPLAGCAVSFAAPPGRLRHDATIPAMRVAGAVADHALVYPEVGCPSAMDACLPMPQVIWRRRGRGPRRFASSLPS